MPRAGLNTSEVVASGAELADESGIESVTLDVKQRRSLLHSKKVR
jgi:hypothetical protein